MSDILSKTQTKTHNYSVYLHDESNLEYYITQTFLPDEKPTDRGNCFKHIAYPTDKNLKAKTLRCDQYDFTKGFTLIGYQNQIYPEAFLRHRSPVNPE